MVKNGKSSTPGSKGKLSRINAWTRKHPIKTLFLVLVLVLAVWVSVATVIHNNRVSHQRTQFIQAKADLQDIYGQVAAQLGQPAAHKSSQTCHYTSSEFDTGYLSCDVDEYFFYDTDSINNAATLANKIQGVINTNQLVSGYRKSTFQSFGQNGSVLETLFSVRDFKQCGGEYLYATAAGDTTDSNFIFTGKPGLSIDFNCSMGAMAEYFPVVKN